MPLIYDKLFTLLKDKSYTMTRVRKENLIGQGTLTAIRRGSGGLSHSTIEDICRVLNCQPGDIMEYVKDELGNGE